MRVVTAAISPKPQRTPAFWSAGRRILALVLLVVFGGGCMDSEEIDFAPDQLRARHALLTACGQGQLTPVEPTREDLVWMLERWREMVRRWQGYSESEMDRLITPSAVTYVDGRLGVDAYYVQDWVYLPFETRAEITDPTDPDTVDEAIWQGLRESGIGPLPTRPPLPLDQADTALETGCEYTVLRSSCPPVRLFDGSLWYEPAPESGGDSFPALRLRDGALCCSGLAKGCQ